MNFRQKNNDFERRGGNTKFIVAGFFVILLIAIFSFSGPRELLFGIASPFWGVRNSIASFFASDAELLASKSALIAENDLLKKEISDETEDQLLSVALKDENQDLKSILNVAGAGQKNILAAVLSKPSFSPYDTLVIGAGSADGIAIGDQVFSDAFPIGFVSDIYEHSAKVILYSSSGEKVDVFVGPAHIEEQALGAGGGNFTVQAPIGSAIAVGDPITLPSGTENVLGTVEKIESKPTDSFETVMFGSPVNIFELAWAEVAPSFSDNASQ